MVGADGKMTKKSDKGNNICHQCLIVLNIGLSFSLLTPMASTNVGVNHKSNHQFVDWISRMFRKRLTQSWLSYYKILLHVLKVAEFYFRVNLQKARADVAWANPWKRSPCPFENLLKEWIKYFGGKFEWVLLWCN